MTQWGQFRMAFDTTLRLKGAPLKKVARKHYTIRVD
jgi:hypothetical protein